MIKSTFSIVILLFFSCLTSNAQYTSYKISPNGDTLNSIDKQLLDSFEKEVSLISQSLIEI